jgi:hypothetical protein
MTSWLQSATTDVQQLVLSMLPPHLRVPDKTGRNAAERRSKMQAWQRATCPLLRQSVLTQLTAMRTRPPPDSRLAIEANGVFVEIRVRSRPQELLVVTAVLLLLYPYDTKVHPTSDSRLIVDICGHRRTTITFYFGDSSELAMDVLRCQQTLRLFKEECESRNGMLPYAHAVHFGMLYGDQGLNLSRSNMTRAFGLVGEIFAALGFLQPRGFGLNYPSRS